MNIKKNNRLSNQEIKYIIKTKNKNFLRWKILNINVILQSPWKNYNKFWISISSKFHKKAVYRNLVRRIFFHVIYENDYIHKKTKNWYVKIYVSLKKNIKYDFLKKNVKDSIKKDLEEDLKIIL